MLVKRLARWGLSRPLHAARCLSGEVGPGEAPPPGVVLPPSHDQLIQSLRSSIRADSSGGDGMFGIGRSTIGFSGLFGGGGGGDGDDPEDRPVLEALRKLEEQYRKWRQLTQAEKVHKEIMSMENAARERFTSWKRPSSQHNSQQGSHLPSGPDVRADPTGVDAYMKKGHTEEEACELVALDLEAESKWKSGPFDPERRSRWLVVREKVINGDIDFERGDHKGDDLTSQLKQYMFDGAGAQPDNQFAAIDSTTDASSAAVNGGARRQVVGKKRERKVDAFGRSYGTGRRKTSVARVFLTPVAEGREGISMIINGRDYIEYFTRIEHRSTLFDPFLVTDTYGKFNVRATAAGGGLSGQAGAIRLGVARALQNFNPDLRPALKQEKFLTRDARMVERKKFGRKKARKSFPFVKR